MRLVFKKKKININKLDHLGFAKKLRLDLGSKIIFDKNVDNKLISRMCNKKMDF